MASKIAMQLNPDNIYQKLVEAGDAWAEAHEVAELLEESKKTLISQLAADSTEKSMAGKEAEALRHPDYERHIKAMTVARKAANKAKVRYDSAKVWAELKRTEAANLRATGGYTA